MAVTTIGTNNKLLAFAKDINREFVRENLFSPYMSEGLDAVIRMRMELKSGGEQMNIPMVTKLNNGATGVGTLVGAEEKVDNYGMRVWLDWARNAVVTNKAEQQKDSADLFGEFKPLLSNWGKELQRDEILAALMALPSESAPAGLGTAGGQRVNGILFDQATAAQKQTASYTDNGDRWLFGSATSNISSSAFATSCSNAADTQTMSASIVSMAKRTAMLAAPAIRPTKTPDGYEWYVCFMGTNAFRDLKADLKTVHTTAYQNSGKGNILFQDGDILWDGVIVRQVPEITGMVSDVWTQFKTSGPSNHRQEPYFLCGQQAAAICWGQPARPTVRAEDDYGFVTGVGVEMAYGAAKMFKKHPMSGTALVNWGVMTGVVVALGD